MVESEYDPKEVEKYQAKTFNKSIGYRSIKKGENHKRLGTEIKGAIWHDRKLLETIKLTKTHLYYGDGLIRDIEGFERDGDTIRGSQRLR